LAPRQKSEMLTSAKGGTGSSRWRPAPRCGLELSMPIQSTPPSQNRSQNPRLGPGPLIWHTESSLRNRTEYPPARAEIGLQNLPLHNAERGGHQRSLEPSRRRLITINDGISYPCSGFCELLMMLRSQSNKCFRSASIYFPVL
jgi:hypothetical protein